MTPSDLAGVASEHGALGMACIVIAGLAWATVHLYRSKETQQREHMASALSMLERQLSGEAKLTAALVAVKDAVALALSVRRGEP